MIESRRRSAEIVLRFTTFFSLGVREGILLRQSYLQELSAQRQHLTQDKASVPQRSEAMIFAWSSYLKRRKLSTEGTK